MGSSPRSLDLRVMYCKDLKAFNFFQKLSVYAVVCLVSDNPSMMKQQQRTPTDTEGDGNPEWNHQMRFNLGLEGDYDGDGDGDDHHPIKKNHHHLFLHFDMRTELAIFGDKSVGEVRVPLKDVINREEEEEEEEVESSDGIIRFVSYEVRTSDGKPNGVLSFSYKVLNECNGSSSLEKKKKKKKNAHIDSYPILNHINHHHNHFHYPSLLPDDYLQIPSGSGSGQSPESYYSATAVDAPRHRVHYPSLEIPYPPPPPPATEEDYGMNYPQPHDQLHFHYPPPPPPPPLISHPPFPPPHLHLPLPPHAVQGSIVYYPQLYEHPYPN